MQKDIYYDIYNGKTTAAVFFLIMKCIRLSQSQSATSKIRGPWIQTNQPCIDKVVSNWENTVCKEEKNSNTTEIDCGVSQGSILGPVLLLHYINDLELLTIKRNFTLFADDTTLVLYARDVETLSYTEGSDINEVKGCCDFNSQRLL